MKWTKLVKANNWVDIYKICQQQLEELYRLQENVNRKIQEQEEYMGDQFGKPIPGFEEEHPNTPKQLNQLKQKYTNILKNIEEINNKLNHIFYSEDGN